MPEKKFTSCKETLHAESVMHKKKTNRIMIRLKWEGIIIKSKINSSN